MPYLTSVELKESIIFRIPTILIYVINTPGSIMNSSKSNIFDIYDSLTHLFSLFGNHFEKYKE